MRLGVDHPTFWITIQYIFFEISYFSYSAIGRPVVPATLEENGRTVRQFTMINPDYSLAKKIIITSFTHLIFKL